MQKWEVLAKVNDLKDVLDALLINRGHETEAERKLFLEPPELQYFLKELPLEFKKSLKKAREIIFKAIKEEIPIVVYGDYDADGVCATAILYNTLSKELGYEKLVKFIPNRFEHGYGMSKKAIKECLCKTRKFGPIEKTLFITVDTGITAVDEVEFLKSMGHMVIITDHHQKPSQLPDADAIVWNDDIVGSTVSWILSMALGSKDSSSVALAGLATVTDVQDLKGFNRTLVKNALEILNENPPRGLKELILSSVKNPKDITTYDLGWNIGPRINASGRMIDASIPLNLLTGAYGDINNQVAKLNEINQRRQDKTLKMYDLAQNIDSKILPKILVSAHKDYHEGLIGLVASRLVRKYNRPSIVISIEDDHAKGSVRSVKGINIIEILRNFEDLFVNLGGHPMAAGFTIPKHNIKKLERSLYDYSVKNISDDLLVPILEVDVELPSDLISFDLIEELEKLKPFGVGNAEPAFLSKNLAVVGVNLMGSDSQHMSLRLYDGQNFYKAVYFNVTDHPLCDVVSTGDKIDIVYSLKINEFRGNKSIDLMLKDFKLNR